MVITKFILGAKEVEMDAVAKDGVVSNLCHFAASNISVRLFFSYKFSLYPE